MVEIVAGELIRNETNKNAMGGTEMMAMGLQSRLPQELLKDFQIINSRPREIRDDLKTILVCHDLPGDPEVAHLKNGGWDAYDKLVFVSNWQLQMYNAYLGVPYSKSVVLQNAIEPIPTHLKSSIDDGINLIYHTTPHRGLELLYPVFNQLSKDFDNVHLDVYSSFEMYGLGVRDEEYKKLFDLLRSHPNITYHGFQPNEVVRKALTKAHIFVYPSIWQETSCIALMEALSAECLVVHPNLAALPETAANWTNMYQWHENPREHIDVFYKTLYELVDKIVNENRLPVLSQSSYANRVYGWDNRIPQWKNFLESF